MVRIFCNKRFSFIKKAEFLTKYRISLYSEENRILPINVVELAGYTPNLYEYEPLNIFGTLNTLSSEVTDNDWNNPIFHEEPKTPKPWVEYYRQSAVNGELLTIDDIIFKDHWEEYHSWADKWDCNCKKEDRTEWCYCSNNKSCVNCSQW